MRERREYIDAPCGRQRAAGRLKKPPLFSDGLLPIRYNRGLLPPPADKKEYTPC
ncbi:hypothetical protein HMPREF9120_01416 [Neisseria sp. oral taxon 020 str. F0370]|nr:hypothetical protein HMPREF9120_01416 [Neisseria sp. oral taxon 020 str. F0370]